MKRRQTGLELGEGMRHVWEENRKIRKTKKQLKENKKSKKEDEGFSRKIKKKREK